MTEYMPSDVAKCAGNRMRSDCNSCARLLLPVHPEAVRQSWMAPWEMDGSCPSYLRDPRETRWVKTWAGGKPNYVEPAP